MADPEKYKADFPKKASEKLFIARTKEGEPNIKPLETVRKLADELARFNSFVAVAMRGSSVLGYSTLPEDADSLEIGDISDIDVDVLYRKPDRVSGEYGAVINAADEFAARYKKNFGQAIHIIPADVSEKALLIEIENREIMLTEGFASLCELATGKQNNKSLREVRKWSAQTLRELSEDARREMLGKIVDTLVYREELAFGKMDRRVNDQKGNWNREEFLTNRKSLWEKRVRGIFKA